MAISRVLCLFAYRGSRTLAGIVLQPPDVHRAWLLKPALKFELHPVAYPELVRPAVGPGPLEGNLFPVFGQKAAGPVFP
ncbi:MAG: hypothetical protein ACLP00_10115 [Terracidiphilus sp.]